MRIAIYSNIEHEVPPPTGRILAPWVLTDQLANRLVDRGHQVWLYALKESQTKAQLIHRDISSQADFYINKVKDYSKVDFLDHALLSDMYADANTGKFDIIHVNYTVARAIHFINFTSTPTTITLHDPLVKQPYIFDLYQNNPQLHLTPISQNQKTAIPDLPFTDVVYNGLDTDKYAYQPKKGDYLLFAGRVNRVKGVHTAIKVAKSVGIPLVIAGEVYHASEDVEQYWTQEIEPQIDGEKVMYAGALDATDLAKAYQSAAALLFPIEWEEPFGLVMAEAMSCGTPVIAFRRGSVPEIVEDGKTGFIVDTVDQMIQAVGKINLINRADCRQRVEAHFSLDAMVNGYEKVYQQLIDENKKGSK